MSNCSGAIPLSIDSLGGNLDSQNTCRFGGGQRDQVNTDPLLFPLRVNDLGFPGEVLMPTHGIPNASPLTDNGLNDGCPATDARNLTRPRDSNGDGSAICDIGALEGNGPTGLGLWQPQESEAKAGQQATFTFSWAVPPPQVWRDLRSLELRLVRNGNVAFWLFWDQQSNAFQLVDPTTRQPVGPARQPGSAGDLATALVSLALGSTQAVGSGPTGVLTTLKLPLTFAPAAVGQTFTVESKAVTDAGALQGFETVGTVTVVAGEAGVEPDTKNDENNERRLTEEQRRQRQRTNTGGLDDDRTEGNVLQTDCEVDPPVATIANRDGEQRVVFLYDTKPYCRSLKPGDYLESEGEKQSEAEFWAHEVSATRGGQRVR